MLRLGLLLCGGCHLIFPVDPAVVTDAADAGDAAVSPPGCSLLSMIGENFDDAVLAEHWEIKGQGTSTIPTQQLVLNALVAQTKFVESRHYYDLTDSELAVDVTTDGAGEGGVGLIDERTGDTLAIRIKGGMAIGTKILPDMTELARGTRAITGNAARLIIRNTETETEWLVEDDGARVRLGAEARETSFVRPALFSAATDSGDAEATFDNLNTGAPTGRACPIAQIADPFDVRPDPKLPLGRQWARSDESSCTFTFGPSLFVSMPVGSFSQCDLMSSTVYDLTTGPIAVEIIKMGTAKMRFGLPLDNQLSVEFEYDGTDLRAVVNGAQTPLVDKRAYKPDTMRWLRLRYDDRSDAREIVWEISGDGVTFDPFARASPASAITRIAAAPVRLQFFDVPADDTGFTIGAIEPR